MSLTHTISRPQNSRYKDKIIIITGASSALGIGRATAHLFAAHQAGAIYLCDISSKNLSTHAKEITSLYPATKVHVHTFDATDESAVKAVVDDAIDRYGRLDVMFANAGVATGKHFAEVGADEFMKNVRVNLLSVFLAIKHASKAMLKTAEGKKYPGGSIIATASVAGIRSNAGDSSYSAGKAAVISLVQTTAYQLSGTGIRVNAVCPGIIETGMTSVMYEKAREKGTQNKIGQLNPLKRGAVADEVARVVGMLAGDEASYVNGQAWAVDGGLTAGLPYVLGKLA